MGYFVLLMSNQKSNSPDEPATEATTTERKASRGSLLVIFLTVFIDLLGFGIVLPLLPIYADIFGHDESGIEIGLLMASFSIMQFIFAPIWGSLSDRIGRRPVIIVGLAGSVVFYALFAFAAMRQSLIGLFVTRIGAGICGATIPTAQAYIADTTSNENRARGMALIGMAFGLGFTLGPMFAIFAVPTGDTDPGAGPGFVAAGLSAVALLLAIFKLPESLHPDSKTAAKKWFDWTAWKAAMGSRAMMYLLLGFFLCLFAFSSFETTLSLLIKGSKHYENPPFNFSFQKVCGTFALIGLLVAIVQGGVVRQLAKRVSEIKLAIAGAAFEVVGFGVLTYGVSIASEFWLYAALGFIVVGYSCLQPSIYSLISRWSDPTTQGRTLGVSQSIGAMARIIGSGIGIPMLMYSMYFPYIFASATMLFVAIAMFLAGQIGKDFEKVA